MPLSPLQINYKRLGNHSKSIWPWALGLVFDPTPLGPVYNNDKYNNNTIADVTHTSNYLVIS